jgi:outer membrane lipoprotein-sorting protein
VGAPRLRLACAAVALLVMAAAILVGANPLVTTIAAVTALAAYLAGIPSIAAAAAITGVIGDVVLRDGASRATGEVLFGLGLVVVGLACRAMERDVG